MSLNVLSTAPQQAGKAPICSGSTTCCATTSPLAFIRAQEASCDSRTMVEKPVRNSEFCISCTIPESDAFTTSKSTASTCINDSLVEGGNRCRELGRLPPPCGGGVGRGVRHLLRTRGGERFFRVHRARQKRVAA